MVFDVYAKVYLFRTQVLILSLLSPRQKWALLIIIIIIIIPILPQLTPFNIK